MDAIHILSRRLRLQISAGVVISVDDTGPLQRLQVELRAGQVRSCNRVGWYGFTSVPPVGSRVIVISVGSSDYAVVIAADSGANRLRNLLTGEVALYTELGDRIVISRGRVVSITASTALQVNAPSATFSGDVAIAGELTVQGIPFTTHVHPGVTPGGSSTGAAE